MNRFPQVAVIGLLIENRPDEQLLAELLRQTGYSVVVLTPAGLERAEPAASLIIVDESSARRHHVQLSALRQLQRPLYVPMLLALPGKARATAWLRAGFDDVLRLPLRKDDLLARLEAFLRLRQHSEDMLIESTQRFHATFDLAPVGIVHMALDGQFLLFNTQFRDMLGYGDDEISGLTIHQIAHPDEGADFEPTIARLLAGPEAFSHRCDMRYRCRDGDFIWTSVAISLVRDGRQNPLHLIAVIENITARKQMEHALRQSERFMKSTIDALSQHICVTDEDGIILTVNKAWQEFALAHGVLLGAAWEKKNYLAIHEQASDMGAHDAGVLSVGLREVARGLRDEFNMGYRCNSSTAQRWFTVRVTRFPAGGATRLVIAREDVTQTRQAEDELQYLAHHDKLTGLPNRSLLQDRLRQAIVHADRYGYRVWVIFIDLDRFKLVNDTLGHKAGDCLLNTIAARLQLVLRGSDTAARFGGDEFVLILSEHFEEGLTPSILHRVMSTVAEPVVVEEQQFFLSCSMGVAVYPNDAADPETLVDHADRAMYRAKALGRNTYQFYAPAMNEFALERLRLEKHLRNALERNEFILHYQPQVDLTTGEIVGMEALIRWQHPELGMVSPDQFIGLAEETGLIVPIGAWVMRTACAQNKAWQRSGLGNFRIAVNLSARQFSQENLVESVASILAETGLAPQHLDIEITESVVMTDVEEAVDTLNAFKALGVQLSIDDFGTGYSSLSYLQRFPIDVLKIDRSFVGDITESADKGAIANAIIAMAHNLGISVIAEGVETEAQCDMLSQNLCDEIQGYWFSRPVAADAIETMLQEKKTLPANLLRLRTPQRTLLIVDDEENIGLALKRALRSTGIRILMARSGREVLELLAEHRVDVILADQRMPGMTGVEFLRTAKQKYPDAMRIILSGYTELQSITDAVNAGAVYRFLTKPWEDDQLRKHLEEAFEHKEMADENRRLNVIVQTANKDLAASNRQLRNMVAQKQGAGGQLLATG
ncbi:EAL domain-containing protein [Pseudoduganella sp. LjRoot289]|uniref:EAL domain-containing protein n=1 Tax=Pseudoduganella sp. LjRoot289 TaxID=3342314 RepID=UPI003ECD19BA